MKPCHLSTLVTLALFLTACVTSTDEPDSTSPVKPECGSEKIEFNLSFSQKSISSSPLRLPSRFAVSAVISNPDPYAEHQIFFDHDVMEDVGTDGSHRWVDRSASRCWPADPDCALDFFFYGGIANGSGSRGDAKDIADSEIIWDRDSSRYTPSLKIWIDEEFGRQYDLVAGASFNQKRKDLQSGDPMKVNLCHPMTQVLFDTELVNENLHVEIFDIELCGTAKGAYFEFPVASGKEPHWSIPQHSDNHVDAHISVCDGDGGVYGEGLVVVPELKGISYTGDSWDPQPIEDKSLWLIPGNYKRGTYMGGMWAGTYLRVRCAVWNVAQRGHFDRDGDVVLYGERNPDSGVVTPEYMYMPINWGETGLDPSRDMGCTYIYTLKFGVGNSGKSPDGLNLNNIASYEIRIENLI